MSWGLDAKAVHAYSHAVARYLPDGCSHEHIRQIAVHYHQDHLLVDSLSNPAHPQHEANWAAWTAQVVPILRHAGLDWSQDAAIDSEDLAQIARTELARSIPTFRYASRFSTWARQVVVRSVQRYLRDRQAGRRAGRPTSLDVLSAAELPRSEAGRPEPIVDARVLAALIHDILHAQPDQRLALIFQLWVGEDVRVEEIGRRVQLSPSQVRALLGRIRQILRSEPSIRAWREDQEPPQEPVAG